jgi:hypothetical protein
MNKTNKVRKGEVRIYGDIGTPLTDKGYVDWDKMLVLLRQNNLL